MSTSLSCIGFLVSNNFFKIAYFMTGLFLLSVLSSCGAGSTEDNPSSSVSSEVITSKPVGLGCLNPVFTASSSEDDINTPDKVNDDNPNTRWSSNSGDASVWLQVDCGASLNLIGITVEFFKSNERVTDFDIEGSINGNDWISLAPGLESSGQVSGAEYFSFGGAASLRYIRYVGYGNSENSWNSLNEFKVVKEGDPIPDITFEQESQPEAVSNCPGVFDLPNCMDDMSRAGGGTITLANKTYKLTTSLVLKDKVNIVGQQQTVITFDESVKATINEPLLYASKVSNVALKRIKLLCSIDQDPNSSDMRNDHMGVFLYGEGDPSYGEPTSNNNIYMESIEAMHCSNGMYLKGVTGFTAVDLHLHNNGNTEFDLFHNISLRDVADVVMMQTTQTNAGFYSSNRGHGIRMSNISNVYSENLKVYGNAGHGIHLADGIFDARFHNVELYDNCSVANEECNAIKCYGNYNDCDINYSSKKEVLSF